jgi:serine/threonine-protein kinase
MTLHYVPAGEFIMGSEDGSDDEKPIHTVDLDAFWIDQTEVTNVMFADFIDETGYTTDAEKAGTSWVYQDGDWNQVDGADWMHPFGPSSGISDIINHPVIHISWNDAQAYCSWADRRLPTEAEWEKAARGAEGNVYPWGDTFDGERLNFCDSNCSFDWADKNADDDYEFTAPVGTYPNGASPYGALDMAGNVWEWVNDWYDAYPGNTVSDDGYGTTYRVLRGGSWGSSDSGVRSAGRGGGNSTDSVSDIGFRCSRSP